MLWLVRRSSSLLSRLALALLALMGFVAPLSAVETDRVVQTDGGRPSPVEELGQVELAGERSVVSADEATFPRLHRGPTEVSRRYLLHGAWLI